MTNRAGTPESAGTAETKAGQSYAPQWMSWSMWAIAALFYLTAFYQLTSPAVMTTELMRDFHISAGDLGSFSAFYFYPYVFLQIPIGILIDSWGAKKLMLIGAFASGGGTFVVALAPSLAGSFAWACAGRAVVGAATAVGWLALLRVAAQWLPPKQFATVTGFGLCVGNVGAVLAQVPLRMAIESFGWRAVMTGSATFIVGVGILIWAFIRNDPAERGFRNYAPPATPARAGERPGLAQTFKQIFSHRNSWLIFFAQGGIVGPLLTFTSLWGGPFMRTRFGLAPKSAAAICSLMIICWAIGAPIAGNLSDRIGRRKPLYLGGAITLLAGWIVMFFVKGLPVEAFIAVAAVTSLATGAIILGFPLGKESVPIRFAGTIAGIVTCGNMIGPMLLNSGIGRVLDQRWNGQMVNGLRAYGVESFQTAFLLAIGWSVLTCLLLSFTRETGCRQRG